MAKSKNVKEGKNAKSHLKARMDFLEKAAIYLQSATAATTPAQTGENNSQSSPNKEVRSLAPENLDITAKESTSPQVDDVQQKSTTTKKPLTNLSRVYISHMRGVSLKTLTRLPIPVKRSFCKHCETPLSLGVTCSQETQNASRGRKKPWADVSVVRCLVCGTEKRFPETERKGKKLVERRKQKQVPVQAPAQNQDGIS